MENHFERVKRYLQELNYDITYEDSVDQLFVINDEENGIKNLIVDCEQSIVTIEQYIVSFEKDSMSMFKSLLQKNREIVHGAFVIDDSGTRVLFRDTLQLENLDLNELEGSINSLKLLLAEYSGELLKFHNNQ
jgi:Putative bacterial sensory transduction regulator